MFPTTVLTFLQHRTTIAPPPQSTLRWLIKRLMVRVRNFKCIFLKCLLVLLYRLTSRQHFYFARYLNKIKVNETMKNTISYFQCQERSMLKSNIPSQVAMTLTRDARGAVHPVASYAFKNLYFPLRLVNIIVLQINDTFQQTD